nr:V-type proton ATPase subunit E [Ipomoea batatas]
MASQKPSCAFLRYFTSSYGRSMVASAFSDSLPSLCTPIRNIGSGSRLSIVKKEGGSLSSQFEVTTLQCVYATKELSDFWIAERILGVESLGDRPPEQIRKPDLKSEVWVEVQGRWSFWADRIAAVAGGGERQIEGFWALFLVTRNLNSEEPHAELLGLDSIPDPNMNDADVSKQIQQMVRFIRQEAEEKANEISVSAEEVLEFVVSSCSEYSMQLNSSRIKVLQAQDDLVNSMKDAASKELLRVSHDHHSYKKLLHDLIVQSLLKLKEPSVLLRCRKDDVHLVEHVLDSAKEEYAAKERVHPPEIIIDHIHLPPAPSHHNAHGLFCSGGVVLASRDGKIVCENTLDARLEVLFRKKLPERKSELRRASNSPYRVDPIPDPNMNDADVSKQIQQMVRFIRQEAEEKANEISVSAEEHAYLKFILPKLILKFVMLACSEYSMQLNSSRIKVLQAQDDLVNSMKDAASKELLHVSHDHHNYKKLLHDLIVQSLLKLKEPSVLLRCRKDDVHLVEHVLHSAKEEYAAKESVHPPEIIIDHIHLPPAPSHHNAHGLFCSGGVVLASRDGKIVCENTLDARLEVLFRKKLPEIRKLLFGQVAA